jgi:hypothetical protein
MVRIEGAGQSQGVQGAAGRDNNKVWADALGGKLLPSDIAQNFDRFVADKGLTGQEAVKFNQLFNRTMSLWGKMHVQMEGCIDCQGKAFMHLLDIAYGEMPGGGASLQNKLAAYADWRAFDDLLIDKGNKAQGMPSSFIIARLRVSKAIREDLLSFKDFLGAKSREALVDTVINFCKTMTDDQVDAFNSMDRQHKVTTLISFIRSNISQT